MLDPSKPCAAFADDLVMTKVRFQLKKKSATFAKIRRMIAIARGLFVIYDCIKEEPTYLDKRLPCGGVKGGDDGGKTGRASRSDFGPPGTPRSRCHRPPPSHR